MGVRKVLNYGSINIDHVYQVSHFVRPGETLAAKNCERFPGGKGANQSVAIARAGGVVFHAGKIGKNGKWLEKILKSNKVDTRFIQVADVDTGHAIIQVDQSGENAIIIYSGANSQVDGSEISLVLSNFEPGDILLLQNEINLIPELIREGSKRGLYIVFNPAPIDAKVVSYPLHLCDLLILNETEAKTLAGCISLKESLQQLSLNFSKVAIMVTAGKKGAYYQYKGKTHFQPAFKVESVDSTAAGDTFIGYFLAAILQEMSIEIAMEMAARAAAYTVCHKGAMQAIPFKRDLTSIQDEFSKAAFKE